MYKVLLFLSIFISSIFADKINFSEEKYLGSLETSVYKYGTIEFNNDFVKVSYKNISNEFLFFDDYLIIKNKNDEQKFDYEEKIELSLFSKLINLIYRNQEENVDNFFKIEKSEDVINLIPNEYLANSISKIEYKKDENVLKYLKIYFKNEDYIKIVQN